MYKGVLSGQRGGDDRWTGGGDGHWPLAFVVEIRPDPLILVFFATHTHSPGNGHERPPSAADTRSVGLPRAPESGGGGAGGCMGGGPCGGGGAGGDGGGGHDVAAHIRWHRRLRQPRGVGGASACLLPLPLPLPLPPR